jgi:hypothetical protein
MHFQKKFIFLLVANKRGDVASLVPIFQGFEK